ncbi:hypothetical protein [Synechococcus sp. UW140]|uniref:hypothetical protein n=1 Tax=Synechococcus sp. UW140 TaxID=368503 RepID=UPI0014836725|nr:hypothetical protein [Synechococcus sp. UW140]
MAIKQALRGYAQALVLIWSEMGWAPDGDKTTVELHCSIDMQADARHSQTV